MKKTGRTIWDFLLEVLDYYVIQVVLVILALTIMAVGVGMVVPR